MPACYFTTTITTTFTSPAVVVSCLLLTATVSLCLCSFFSLSFSSIVYSMLQSSLTHCYSSRSSSNSSYHLCGLMLILQFAKCHPSTWLQPCLFFLSWTSVVVSSAKTWTTRASGTSGADSVDFDRLSFSILAARMIVALTAYVYVCQKQASAEFYTHT